MARTRSRPPQLASVDPHQWGRIEINAKADGEDDAPSSADVYIYAEIGDSFWGDTISAKDFAAQIASLDVDDMHVYINSPGGSAWDGLAIMNALRRHPAHVEVTVDALAASAASVIAMAGDHIVMNRGAELMIHEASGMAWGTAQDMHDTAVLLDKLCDSYADTYAARAGGDREKWRAVMRAETWYTAEEAVLAGLADEWVDAPAAAASLTHFDLSKFRHQGRAHAPAPAMFTKLPASEPGDNTSTNEEELKMSDILAAGLRERLGVTDAEITDQALLTMLDERLTPSAEATTFEPPEGTVLIDAAAYAELQKGAQEGREALAAQTATRRDGIVTHALQEGRIAPASKAQWREMLDKDETGTKALLDSMPTNTVPVHEVGLGDNTEISDDAKNAAAWGMKQKGENR